jgi:hypothetical protein
LSCSERLSRTDLYDKLISVLDRSTISNRSKFFVVSLVRHKIKSDIVKECDCDE